MIKHAIIFIANGGTPTSSTCPGTLIPLHIAEAADALMKAHTYQSAVKDLFTRESRVDLPYAPGSFKIAAVKLVRNAGLGLDLKEAKDFVEELHALPSPLV